MIQYDNVCDEYEINFCMLFWIFHTSPLKKFEEACTSNLQVFHTCHQARGNKPAGARREIVDAYTCHGDGL